MKKTQPVEKFSVRRTKAGLGLFTNTSFKKGDRIIEYTGEIISVEEANRRGGKYLFAINSRWYIDGKGRENIARYINHSCAPNAEARGSGKKVFVYALRTIRAGEEIGYDYGKEYVDAFIAPSGCRCAHCTAV